MRRGEFYVGTIDGDLTNEWVLCTISGVIYTDRRGRNMGTDSSICQIPRSGPEEICARRWHMRATRGVIYKECQLAQLPELQIDAVALRRWILMVGNDQEACEGARRTNNTRLLNKIEERWGVDRTENADEKKQPLLEYEKWEAIDRTIGREVRTQNAAGGPEKEGEVSRWGTWDRKKHQRSGNCLRN